MMVSGAFIGSAGGAAGGLSLLRGRRAAVEQRLGPVADDREARPIIGMRRLLVVHQPHLRCPQRIGDARPFVGRSEEHTSELQSLMRISYAVFCLKKKKQIYNK